MGYWFSSGINRSEVKPNNIQNNTTGLSFLNSSAENDANANLIYGNSIIYLIIILLILLFILLNKFY